MPSRSTAAPTYSDSAYEKTLLIGEPDVEAEPKSEPGADVNTPGEHLWNFSRLKPNMHCLDWVFLVIWTPFGVFLCLLRCIFWPVGMLLYPLMNCLGLGRCVMRVMAPLWGVHARISGLEELDNSFAPIMVSNHISDFDACALWTANPPAEQRLVVNLHWKKVIDVARCLGWPIDPIYTEKEAQQEGTTAKDVIRTEVKTGQEEAEVSGVPPKRLLIFPEGKTSSGMMVMVFNWYIFGLEAPVVPVALRLWNPWPLQIQCNGCSVIRNLLTLFFLPMVVYHIDILPEMTCGCQSKGAFAEDVRHCIASHLNLPCSKFSAKDKTEFAKEILARRSR